MPAIALRILETGSHLRPIGEAARAVGFKVLDNGANDWNLLWSFRTPWEDSTFKTRTRSLGRQNTLVNHMPGTLRLASKAHLPAFMRTAHLANATPTSYMLPEQINELQAALRAAPSLSDEAGLPLWLLKSKQHRGVRVLVNSTRRGLMASAPAIAQRRVRPLLLHGLGRMFDIGLYVLVASVRPLRVYAFDRALVRVCELPFPRTHAEFLAKPGSYVIKNYTPIWTLPFFAAALRQCDDSAACALRRALGVQGHDGGALWRRMEGIAGTLLEKLLPHVETGLTRVGLEARHVFELFRFDFLVDEHAQPVLTEVNLSPNMVGAHGKDTQVKGSLLRDLMRLVTARLSEEGAAESEVAGGWKRIH